MPVQISPDATQSHQFFKIFSWGDPPKPPPPPPFTGRVLCPTLVLSPLPARAFYTRPIPMVLASTSQISWLRPCLLMLSLKPPDRKYIDALNLKQFKNSWQKWGQT